MKQEKGEKQVEIIIPVGRNERAHGSGAQPGSAIGPRIFPHTAYLFQRLHVITSPSYSSVTIRSSPCLPRSKKKSGKSSRITLGILFKKKKRKKGGKKNWKSVRVSNDISVGREGSVSFSQAFINIRIDVTGIGVERRVDRSKIVVSAEFKLGNSPASRSHAVRIPWRTPWTPCPYFFPRQAPTSSSAETCSGPSADN